MLRPSNSLLGSSRAARRRNVRDERVRALGSLAKGTTGAVQNLFGTAFDLLLLGGLPLLYLAASYLAFDLPARWIWGRESVSLLSVVEFLAALAISLVGIARVLQKAQPIAPVRPEFARLLLLGSWGLGVIFTVADLAQ